MKKDNISLHTAAARHARILALLRDDGEVRIRHLRKELGVTAMTLWRDLRLLEELGQLRRVHGGARLPPSGTSEPDFENKTAIGALQKRLIAMRAVREFVHEGDVIGMEGGSTVAALAAALPKERVSVVTNSLPIALALRTHHPALPVRVLGGWLSAVSGNTTGQEAIKAAEGLRLSVCFLSATGWVRGVGPTDPNPLEIEVKRALACRAQKVVLLMHAEKFKSGPSSVVLHPRRVDAIVTDRMPPEWVQAELRGAGIRLVCAGKKTRA